MFYKYKAKNDKGKLQTGLVEAQDEKAAASLLREQGLLAINIELAGTGLWKSLSTALKRISFGETVTFTHQLSTMVSSGLTLTESLTILQSQTSNPVMAKVLSDVLRNIEAGSNLGDSLAKFPQYFSKIFVSSIRAGEASGMLDKILVRLADNLEKEKEFRSKISGAMIYPTIIIIGMLAVTFIMMTVVVPKLTAMYRDFSMELPVITKMLIGISDIFVNFWWLLLAGIAGAFFAFKAWKKTSSGRRLYDALMLKLPLLGKLQKQIILVEFSRTLGLLIGAGLPILEALNIVGESLNNVLFQEAIRDAAKKVEKGLPLGVPLSQNEIFPTIMGQMTRVGEETGKLDEALLKLSYYFESESSDMVKALTTAIEPIIMVVLGVGVGFLILATIMPMYQMTDAFNK